MRRCVRRALTTTASAGVDGGVSISSSNSTTTTFTLWCCLEEAEWTRRSSVYKRPAVPRPSKATPALYSSKRGDLETEFPRFASAQDAQLAECDSLQAVDAAWAAADRERRSSSCTALLARSVALSRLANTKRELNRALGAYHRVRLAAAAANQPTPVLHQTVALNQIMQCFFHDPRRAVALLEASPPEHCNTKSYALALAACLQVELSDKTGYFIEKALTQYMNTSSSSSKRFTASASSGSVGRVLELMAARGGSTAALSPELVEQVIIASAGSPGRLLPQLPALWFSVLPAFRETNPLAYLCVLYDAAMVRIRPEDCLAVLAEMEERGVPRSEYHFILAASGLRRRSFLDWETATTTDAALRVFRYVPQSASRGAYNRTHYGPSISPFHILTLQQAYEKNFPNEKQMHPKFAQELVKAYSSHAGLAPFGTSEKFLAEFVHKELLGRGTLIAWEENVMERLVERIARNFQLKLAFSVAQYMGQVHMPRNTATNNALLAVLLQHIRQVPKQYNGHLVYNAETMVRDMCGGSNSAFAPIKRQLQARVDAAKPSPPPEQLIVALAPDVTKFCQPDARTLLLLGSIYHAAQQRQALFDLERSVQQQAAHRDWAKPLQDLKIQMLPGDEALALVGELQTTSVVDANTLHWLVDAMLREGEGEGGRLAEAVANLVGFCRTYKLVPRVATVRRLLQRARETGDEVELGRIRDFCDEVGVAAYGEAR